jgi:hypothetical protein
VATENTSKNAVVIEVTKLFSTDVKAISGLPARYRKRYKVKKLDATRSFINAIRSYPKNIEVIQDFTFDAAEPPSNTSTNTITMRINQSMILLPETPMMPRFTTSVWGSFLLVMLIIAQKL